MLQLQIFYIFYICIATNWKEKHWNEVTNTKIVLTNRPGRMFKSGSATEVINLQLKKHDLTLTFYFRCFMVQELGYFFFFVTFQILALINFSNHLKLRPGFKPRSVELH